MNSLCVKVPVNGLLFRLDVPEDKVSAVVGPCWLKVTFQPGRVPGDHVDRSDRNCEERNDRPRQTSRRSTRPTTRTTSVTSDVNPFSLHFMDLSVRERHPSPPTARFSLKICVKRIPYSSRSLAVLESVLYSWLTVFPCYRFRPIGYSWMGLVILWITELFLE